MSMMSMKNRSLEDAVHGKRMFSFAVMADSHLNPAGAEDTSPWHTNHLANPRNEVVVDAINKLPLLNSEWVGLDELGAL